MTDDAKCPGCEFVPPYGTLAEWDHVYGEANCQVMAGLRATIATLRAERDSYRQALEEIFNTRPKPSNLAALKTARAALNHQEEA